MNVSEDLNIVFRKIIEENKQKILRICRAYAPAIEDQKDLYQEVALNIWKSLPTFNYQSAINTWIYRICLNVCMQYALKLRKNNRNRVDIDGIKISDESISAHDSLEARERTKKMYECISLFTDAEKTLILLFLEDIPYKEISDISGMSENLVAVKIGRIKKKLSNCINN